MRILNFQFCSGYCFHSDVIVINLVFSIQKAFEEQNPSRTDRRIIEPVNIVYVKMDLKSGDYLVKTNGKSIIKII